MTIENALGLGSGTGTQVLRSNGTGNLPTFEDVESCALPILNGSTYTTIGGFDIATLSSGVITGMDITDGTGGVIDIAAGSYFVRSSSSDVGDILTADYAGTTGVALTDNSVNFVYIEYNAGTPQITVTTVPNATPQDFVILGVVYRIGTDLHISPVNIPTGQVAQKLGRRLALVDGVTRQSGIVTGETGTRNVTITAGITWLALTSYAQAAFDSSAADTWTYYYRDGVGGWTAVTSSTQINNTQYDDNSGSLATLANNQYGVHWVYYGIDNDVYVIYGQDTYTLTDAQEALVPLSTPLQITNLHTILISKIIIKKSDAAFTEILLPWDSVFSGGLASAHNDLSGIQGGTTGEYYHMTAAEYGLVDGLTTLTDHGFLLGSGTGVISATAAPGNGEIPIGSAGVDPVITTITGGAGITVTNGAGTITLSSSEAEVAKAGVSNLGISLSAGTFSITSADGTALSSSNKGYVTLPSVATPGTLLTISVEDNHQFVDDAGTSTILGTLWGTTADVDWSSDMLFTIYAIMNDADDEVAFGISRSPAMGISYATANIGASGTVVTTNQNTLFLLDLATGPTTPTIAEYDTNPAIPVGSFRMTKTSTTNNDWTVSALGDNDGIGRFQYDTVWSMPAGVNTAETGTFFVSQAGTEPIFSFQECTYTVTRSGIVHVRLELNNCTTAGTGGTNIQPVLIAPSTSSNSGSDSFYVVHSLAATSVRNFYKATNNNAAIFFTEFYIANTATLATTALIASGDEFGMKYEYKPFN